MDKSEICTEFVTEKQNVVNDINEFLYQASSIEYQGSKVINELNALNVVSYQVSSIQDQGSNVINGTNVHNDLNVLIDLRSK